MQEFLVSAHNALSATSILTNMLDYQEKIIRVVPDFEKLVFDAISTGKTDNRDILFEKYQHLVNLVAENGLSTQTTGYISALDRYEGYEPAVTKEMESQYTHRQAERHAPRSQCQLSEHA